MGGGTTRHGGLRWRELELTSIPERRQVALREMISAVGTPEWRLAWWEELALLQPLVAERLIMKFPDRYPVRRKPLEA